MQFLGVKDCPSSGGRGKGFMESEHMEKKNQPNFVMPCFAIFLVNLTALTIG